jgi:L,D-peptidoglycan transpeptidase YkuD (ErfK/YbiS/YcfS/YnhG family)
MKALILTLFLVLPAFAQVKKPEPPAVKPTFAESLQAVVVTTAGWDTTQGKARLYERVSAKDKWKQVGDAFEITVGRSGMAIDDSEAWEEAVAGVAKKEGDGRSPAGMMPLTYSFGKADRANTKLKYLKIVENTECVDDVNSHHYNKIVNRMQVGIFDWKSSEKMAQITPEYDLGVFVAYNSYPAVKGRGSCIFLHIWETPGDATSGCTAMSRENLERVVAWVDPNKGPYLIQMPETAYKHYEKAWKLPKL